MNPETAFALLNHIGGLVARVIVLTQMVAERDQRIEELEAEKNK